MFKCLLLTFILHKCDMYLTVTCMQCISARRARSPDKGLSQTWAVGSSPGEHLTVTLTYRARFHTYVSYTSTVTQQSNHLNIFNIVKM